MESNGVGENICVGNGAWSFGDEVPRNFTRHVGRSVPGYEEGHALTVRLSDFFVRPDSVCYELGVSTGALVKKLAKHHLDRGGEKVRWVGIDREPAMIVQAGVEIEAFDPRIKNVELVAEDLRAFRFGPADFVVSYYTAQFVHPGEREGLFRRVHQALNPSGGLVLFEKIRGADARFQDILSSLYRDYKSAQGYTSREILTKERGLRGVLGPQTSGENLEMLARAGFASVQPVYQNICFQGLLAIK